MRKRLWQLHSWLGLIAGVALLVLGLSGGLLVFRNEVESLVNRSAVRVAPAEKGRLPFDTLLDRAGQQLADYFVVGWTIRPPSEANYADLLYVVHRGTREWQVATLDPYTGGVLSAPRPGNAAFTGWLLELHYSFLADHTGMLIVGIFGGLLLLLGATGIWIYREFWKHLFTLRWDRGARILFSDLHKFTGITSVVFNLVLGFTGAYWNFTHVIGEWKAGAEEPSKMEQPLYAASISLNSLVRAAEQQLPGYRAQYISFPSRPEMKEITLYGHVPTRNPLRGPYGSTVAYDAQSGMFKSAVDIRTAGLWTQVVDLFVPLHYGTFGGLPIKVLWALGGLAPGVLAISGFLIWWLRRPRRPIRKPASRPHPASSAQGEAAS